MTGKGSKIFTGFRALGFCSNHIPIAVRYHQKHKENYVVTCVGKAFHTYNCSKLGIISVSDSHSDDIGCLAVDAYLVFTGCRNSIQAFEKGKKVIHSYEGHVYDVHLLLPFGKHLISVDVSSNVKIWDISSEEIYLELQFDKKSFKITQMLHPSTYMNKILFGSQQGSMQLWNIRTNKLLFTFPGWGSPITALEQAPAVNVVAVGLDDGRIFIHNIKYDETLIKFSQDWGTVTQIAFRTDGHPIMATGSSAGHIALWNLEEKKLQSQIREAHQGPISGMQCLPSEPLLITSSPDNAIKIWILDQPDGGGRLLRQRSGHSEPPNKVRYHGNNGQDILSSGLDSTLRSFSTIHERHNKSLGRASFCKAKTKQAGLRYDQHKMPPITDFASEHSRQSDWDSIAACHRNLCEVTTWNYQRSTMGSHRLEHTRFKSGKKYINATAQSIAISSCGNFVLVGYSTGHLDLYNMQSGLYRGSYGNEAHEGAVRGVATDNLNQVAVSGGADCLVKFWRFKEKTLLDTLKMENQISKLALHRESSMLAIVLDNFKVIITDIETRRIVRQFSGHTNTVTDLTFSPDSRWLVTASMDGTVRTWDLPTGRLIDCFLVSSPVTSLALSPTGTFLTTSHVDDLGIYLWSNMTLYTHVSLRPLPMNYEPQTVALPSTSTKTMGEISDEEIEDEEKNYNQSDFKSPEQISNELITLSLLPNSRWQNLLHLEVIKQRNKPKEPPKVPKNAPFFLPTVAGLQPSFVAPEDDSLVKDDSSKFLTTNLQPLSSFGKQLDKTTETEDYKSALDTLKEMGPSAIDTEIRSLSPEAGGSVSLMAQFMKMIKHTLGTNKDFELAQSYLGLFLKLHGDFITSQDVLIKELENIQSAQIESWAILENLFNQSNCLVNYLRNAALS